MNPIYSHLYLDLQHKTIDSVNLKQYDCESRYICFHITDNGNPYVLTLDIQAEIKIHKPDDTKVVNSAVVDCSNNHITVEVTSQMTSMYGVLHADITLFREGQTISTMPFLMNVEKSTVQNEDVTSSNEYGILEDLITEVQGNERQRQLSEENRKEAENTRKNNENIRIANENARVSAEGYRKDAESIRQSNENTRKANEIARQNAETDRADAETDRVNAENIRKSNEDIRITNENIRKSNEATRQNNENTRKTNEDKRQIAETARANAENDRDTAEVIRTANENARKTAESTRVSEETKRANAENTRVANEITRQNNESTRQSNESARQTNTEAVIDRAEKAAKACEDIINDAGIVKQTEKGATNGVATLDENKKLTISQLPIATATALGAVKIGSNITVSNGTISISKTNVTNALGFTPIKQVDTTTELISSTEPASGSQNVGDFWLQEY